MYHLAKGTRQKTDLSFALSLFTFCLKRNATSERFLPVRGKWSWDARKVSGVPRHNLPCSKEHEHLRCRSNKSTIHSLYTIPIILCSHFSLLLNIVFANNIRFPCFNIIRMFLRRFTSVPLHFLYPSEKFANIFLLKIIQKFPVSLKMAG